MNHKFNITQYTALFDVKPSRAVLLYSAKSCRINEKCVSSMEPMQEAQKSSSIEEINQIWLFCSDIFRINFSLFYLSAILDKFRALTDIAELALKIECNGYANTFFAG